jgi:hypothetical protein
MPVLTRADDQERLCDEVLRAAVKFLRSKNDSLDDAGAKRLIAKRAARFTVQRAMRFLSDKEQDGTGRVSITMTGAA